MKPSDFRNAIWEEVQEHLSEDMLRVHAAWLEHGPGTTRQVSEKSGISLLTFRPRTTDLYQLGLIECVGGSGKEGVYSYCTPEKAGARWRSRTDLPAEEKILKEVNTLPVRDQVSLAASILARARVTKNQRRAESQPELSLI